MVDKDKRKFLKKSLFREICEITSEFQTGLRKAEERNDFEKFFESYESSYALTNQCTYPTEQSKKKTSQDDNRNCILHHATPRDRGEQQCNCGFTNRKESGQEQQKQDGRQLNASQ